MSDIRMIDDLAQRVANGVAITLNQGFEWGRRLKARNKETKALHDKKIFETHFTKNDEQMPDKMGQQRYLTYALSFIEKEYPLYWAILQLRVMNYSTEMIAKYLTKTKNANISKHEVSKHEAAAMRLMIATIERIKKTGVPIFGEMPAQNDLSDTGVSRPISTGHASNQAPNQGVSNV